MNQINTQACPIAWDIFNGSRRPNLGTMAITISSTKIARACTMKNGKEAPKYFHPTIASPNECMIPDTVNPTNNWVYDDKKDPF